MNISIEQTPLMVFLKSLNDIYYGKALELRDAVQEWLSYIPETFPHYTRHTIKHSEEIVVQISKLLFRDNGEAFVSLSPAEIYILIASAYLHDSGMVSADKEKLGILMTNSEWQTWISQEGGGAKRWLEIEQIRKGRANVNEAARHFVADLQTRYLLAEFIRRTHHIRAADVISQHQDHLGRFAFSDPMMQRTISDVCVAHGLMHHELKDNERYPLRRDIQGHAVNVRLLAILLRLGDLLDMTYDRACPLLMNAANPLPADSLAHWTQYQRIVHRATSPDKIEITAECSTQEEHRVLQDWCQWIVDETRESKGLMSRTELHRDWQPPVALIDGGEATIKIRRSKSANYIPSNWTFKIDHNAVLNILIRDVYNNPLVFLRELIQNALDASRCKMYADLAKEGQQVPEFPTQVAEDYRNSYPVKLKLETRPIVNELSGETEVRQILTIEDCGIGMDREIIERYFLQIGRSYYTTEEFRRNFSFVPTSRFGVGFLSVFAVSDNVIVDTFKPDSVNSGEPILITLRGPRNYLLTEMSKRRIAGTQIEILLKDSIAQGQLTDSITRWCRRVEFPIHLNDLGIQHTVLAESHEQFIDEKPDLETEGSRYIVRAFPINRTGIEGDIYVFARLNNLEERWDLMQYAKSTYQENHPQASVPELPTDLTCLHGIAQLDFPQQYYGKSISARIDYRGAQYEPTVAREAMRAKPQSYDLEVSSRCTEILTEHLNTTISANSKDAWKYRQRLVNAFPFTSFWASLPNMVPLYIQGQLQLVSLREANENEILTTIHKEWFHPFGTEPNLKKSKDVPLTEIKTPAIVESDLNIISGEHKNSLFTNRLPGNIRWINRFMIVDWIPSKDTEVGSSLFRTKSGRFMVLSDQLDSSVICLIIKVRDYDSPVILNNKHKFVQWLKVLQEACLHGKHNFSPAAFENIYKKIRTVAEYDHIGLEELSDYVTKWREIPNIPSELYPPILELSREMFKPSFPENRRPSKRGAKKGTSTKRKLTANKKTSSNK